MSKILIEQINKAYDQHVILDDFSLEINTNEITVLLGKSGCGKTTLLRVLSQLEKIDNGKIHYPKNYSDSFAFQEHRLMPWLSVEKNIAFGLKKDVEISHLLRMIGLEDYKDHYPSQLSGGMKQRVALARALAMNPDLIYMDEPFAALDYFTRLSLQEELLNLYKENQTGMLFVTHNVDEAIKLAHKIIIMSEGQIIKEYILGDVFNRDVYDENNVKIKKEILEIIGGQYEKIN